MKLIGMSIGKDSFISKNTYFMVPQSFTIGDYCHVNRDCILDARGGLRIGNSVSVSHRVNIMTGSHSVNSSMFRTKYLPIIIEDYVWLGVGCTILQNVRIGKGAVVCAGAVVTRDVAPYDIVAGVPAKVIGKRSRNLEYECRWDAPFT
jgi:acetyltransferase-like isoleucine patch superfamily enzyme